MQPINVIESESYMRDAQAIGDIRLMDQLRDALDLILASRPDIGNRVTFFSDIFVIETDAYLPRVAPFRILYQYNPRRDPANVILLAIEPVSPFDGN